MLRTKLNSLYIKSSLGLIKISVDKYIMDIFCPLASIKFCYFHIPVMNYSNFKVVQQYEYTEWLIIFHIIFITIDHNMLSALSSANELWLPILQTLWTQIRIHSVCFHGKIFYESTSIHAADIDVIYRSHNYN